MTTIGSSLTRRAATSLTLGALLSAATALLAPGGASAQADSTDSVQAEATRVASYPPDTFANERTRAVFERARARWLEVDQSIRSYEAEMRSRAAVTLRTPLKDRTIFRAEEMARVRWGADSTIVVQVIGSNEVSPDDDAEEFGPEFTDPVFDFQGRLRLGFLGAPPDPDDASDQPEAEEPGRAADDEPGDDDPDPDDDPDDDPDVDVDVWVENPIAPGSEEFYRYQVADSIRLSFPDGRELQAVALELIPRQRSGRLVSGMIWIEPETGALVRALYRLATAFDIEEELDDDIPRIPGVFRPLQFDISMIAVEYSLWDFRYWLPARVRMEGSMRAGVVRLPGAVEQSFRILDIEGMDDPGELEEAEVVAERWMTDGVYGDFRRLGSPPEGDPEAADDDEEDDRPRRFVLVPENVEDLRSSPLIPPPIWDDAPGFTSEAELEAFARALADLSVPDSDRSRFRWATGPDLGDLTRYNRAEGLAVGGRVSFDRTTGLGGFGLETTGWLGLGTWVPDVRAALSWESPFNRLSAAVYHRTAEVDSRNRSLSVGNSLTALFFGRDDGDYYQARGGSLTWEPIGFDRPWYRVILSAEEHEPLPNETDFTIAGLLGGSDDPFRPALPADPATELAAALVLEPWWGTDLDGVQGGLEVLLQGAGGDYEWFRSRAVGRLAVPLAGDARAGLEVAAGHIWGDAPLQRLWFVGGTRTLRGYPGAAGVGSSYGRVRAELARGNGTARGAVFTDAAWTADAFSFDRDDALWSVGLGLSVLDGLLRFDVARAVKAPTGWRVELYLDSIL